MVGIIMNQKILWKIESLWLLYFTGLNRSFDLDVARYYKDKTSLYNPDFKYVDDFDFQPSVSAVHVDEYGKYKGLKQSQLCVRKKPIYLFDNHNKIIQAFLEYYTELGKSFDVVHIDAHKDDAIYLGKKIKTHRVQDVVKYVADTRISDFFDFFSCSEMILEIHRCTTSERFNTFTKPKRPYLLSLDIDIFGPEGGFVDLENKIKIIAEAWLEADVVCISTSPGFIDQKYAQSIIDIFLSHS